MAALTHDRIANLLVPYLGETVLPEEAVGKLSLYLDLLLHWNARTNLSAVREPEQIMQRQVGESLFCAQLVPDGSNVLDFGSGAGFPGIPLQLLRPDLKITLAESQGKKASFLREAVRVLQIPCRVWAGRVEDLPPGSYDTVMMRAVDRTEAMLPIAESQVAAGGSIIRFLSQAETGNMAGWRVDAEAGLPLSPGRVVRLSRAG